MSSASISLENVSFTYPGSTRPVLESTSLDIQAGEFFVVVGPSGSGKTTLLNLIAGFEKPTQGTIVAGGRVVSDPGPDRLVIFQGDRSLMGWLTALENVELGLRIAGVSRRERRERAESALRMVGLEADMMKRPHELSGGMRQRVQIARAVVCEAPVLLLDEPFASVDALTRSKLQNELAGIAEQTGQTIFFITHDIAEALILGDRVAVMGLAGIARIVNVLLQRPRSRSSPQFGELYGDLEASLLTTTRPIIQVD